MVRVTVHVPDRPYDVVIGSGVLQRAGEHLPELVRATHAFVVTDRAVGALWFDPLAEGLASAGLQAVQFGVPEGEEAKTLSVYGTLLHQLATQEAHRDDAVVALGGGAVGDLVGFVAATYMRGVPFVQVPTTLTAQVDAAIGGKTALNLPEAKNLVGAFYQPAVVLADVGTLATLPDEAFRSGLAEVAKYGLTLDLDLLAMLERDPAGVLRRDPGVLEELVARCVRTKARAVAEDERDAGARLVLNYGHTLGHALERLDEFGGRSHGEGVAVGMMFAARLSEAAGFAVEGLAARHARVLKSLGLEPEGGMPGVGAVMAAFQLDKKYAGGVRFVLLEDVGRPKVVEDLPEDLVRRVLEEMGASA